MAQMDEAYARPEFYWGREPNGLCRRTLELLPKPWGAGRVAVDLGCGEGRDALAFARHGAYAVGVDVSRPGLDKMRRWADEEGLARQVAARHGDIRSFRLDSDVDVVYSSGTLHYLPPQAREAAFGGWKARTRVGGLHAMNVFVEKPFLAVPPDYAPDEYFFRSGELLGHYWDWEVLHVAEFIFDCRSGGVPHRHAMDEIIARRV